MPRSPTSPKTPTPLTPADRQRIAEQSETLVNAWIVQVVHGRMPNQSPPPAAQREAAVIETVIEELDALGAIQQPTTTPSQRRSGRAAFKKMVERTAHDAVGRKAVEAAWGVVLGGGVMLALSCDGNPVIAQRWIEKEWRQVLSKEHPHVRLTSAHFWAGVRGMIGATAQLLLPQGLPNGMDSFPSPEAVATATALLEQDQGAALTPQARVGLQKLLNTTKTVYGFVRIVDAIARGLVDAAATLARSPGSVDVRRAQLAEQLVATNRAMEQVRADFSLDRNSAWVGPNAVPRLTAKRVADLERLALHAVASTPTGPAAPSPRKKM